MPRYTVKYFNAKGMAECIRLLLANNGEEFNNVRYAIEAWPEEKQKVPFGQIPVLQIDDKMYCQSTAISRYLGKKFGLDGTTLEEDMEIDSIVDAFQDLRVLTAASHFEKDEVVKECKRRKNEPIVSTLLNKLETVVAKNNGHVALGKLTWGDFVIAGMLDYLKWMLDNPEFDSTYPSIKQIHDNVYSLPMIKQYTSKLDEYDFSF